MLLRQKLCVVGPLMITSDEFRTTDRRRDCGVACAAGSAMWLCLLALVAKDSDRRFLFYDSAETIFLCLV